MTVALDPAAPSSRLIGPLRLLPGVALSAAIGAVAFGLQLFEARLFGQAWIEGLVLAILIGAALRLVWTPSSLWSPGVSFSAKTLLEVAVALLGATVSGAAVAALGPWLLLAIVGVVALAILGGYALGRAFGLPHAMALLVASATPSAATPPSPPSPPSLRPRDRMSPPPSASPPFWASPSCFWSPWSAP